MKTHIWSEIDPFPDKVNFVDSDNVLLGFDLGHQCCENATWAISHTKDGENPLHSRGDEKPQSISLEGYTFDPAFYELEEDEGDERYAAIFRLVDHSWGVTKRPDLFVRLENCHNGYYSHGFVFKGDPVIIGAI